MGSARESMLAAIRREPWESQPRPELHESWTRYEDPMTQFATVLESVGGCAHQVADLAAVNTVLNDLAAYREADLRSSLVSGVGESAIDPREIEDPHALQRIDFAILSGHFAVAENAAIWVTHPEVRHRAVYFLTQHLALVLAADQIVHNMHEAYARISFDQPGFGCFISGPSKTADIEQSLVIGAHGPRSLNVFLVDRWEA